MYTAFLQQNWMETILSLRPNAVNVDEHVEVTGYSGEQLSLSAPPKSVSECKLWLVITRTEANCQSLHSHIAVKCISLDPRKPLHERFLISSPVADVMWEKEAIRIRKTLEERTLFDVLFVSYLALKQTLHTPPADSALSHRGSTDLDESLSDDEDKHIWKQERHQHPLEEAVTLAAQKLKAASTVSTVEQHRQAGGAVTCVAATTDGHCASAGPDGICVWREAAMEPLYHLRGPTQPDSPLPGAMGQIDALAWFPNNKVLVSGGADGAVRVWAVELEREVRRFAYDAGAVLSVCLPGGRRVLAGHRAGICVEWDTAQPEPVAVYGRHNAERAYACVLAMDDLVLCAGPAGLDVFTASRSSEVPLRSFPVGRVRCAATDAVQRVVLLGCEDGRVVVVTIDALVKACAERADVSAAIGTSVQVSIGPINALAVLPTVTDAPAPAAAPTAAGGSTAEWHLRFVAGTEPGEALELVLTGARTNGSDAVSSTCTRQLCGPDDIVRGVCAGSAGVYVCGEEGVFLFAAR